MYENPYDRRFGIEFEFSMPIGDDLSRWSDTRTRMFRSLLEENGMRDFRVGHDGSDWEVKTPILSGSNGFKRVKRFLNLILENGGSVTPADGLHVHHDAPEFVHNYPLITMLVKNWLINQDEIIKMVHKRRNDAGACPKWKWDYLELIKPVDIYHLGRRNLNVNALTEHGSIEVRLHEGTLDYEEVFSWVRFGQAFIGNTLKESGNELLLPYAPTELMKRINVSRNAAKFIVNKMKKYNQEVQNPVWA